MGPWRFMPYPYCIYFALCQWPVAVPSSTDSSAGLRITRHLMFICQKLLSNCCTKNLVLLCKYSLFGVKYTLFLHYWSVWSEVSEFCVDYKSKGHAWHTTYGMNVLTFAEFHQAAREIHIRSCLFWKLCSLAEGNICLETDMMFSCCVIEVNPETLNFSLIFPRNRR